MIEHVGYKNYESIFKIVHKSLADNGLFLLQTIGTKTSVSGPDPWINKYIFPNGMAPSLKHLVAASNDMFILEDLHNFGAYYDKTLMAWFRNFDNNWSKIQNSFDPKFYRMWKYYLLICAGMFRARETELWQFVFSKYGILDGYNSVR